jgi:hypothetical protein
MSVRAATTINRPRDEVEDLWRSTGPWAAKQIRTAGAIHAGYSTITDYPLGMVKVLPYKAHLALTDPTGRGDSKLEVVDEVRSHNQEDPGRKVNADSLAVTPAAA